MPVDRRLAGDGVLFATYTYSKTTDNLVGLAAGYFKSPENASSFRDDLAHLMLHQKTSFNSPVWFNVGLHHEYKIGKASDKGNWFFNPRKGEAERAAPVPAPEADVPLREDRAHADEGEGDEEPGGGEGERGDGGEPGQDGGREHVAVIHMTHFMSQDCLDLVFFEVLQQSGRYCHH